MNFALQPVRVATSIGGEEGCLLFSDGHLLAVLVRLSDGYDDLSGSWFLEHGFGAVDGPAHPTFADLDAAQDWIEARLANRNRGRAGAPR